MDKRTIKTLLQDLSGNKGEKTENLTWCYSFFSVKERLWAPQWMVTFQKLYRHKQTNKEKRSIIMFYLPEFTFINHSQLGCCYPHQAGDIQADKLVWQYNINEY